MTRVIPFASPENDAHVVVLPRIWHVRQIFVRAIEINVIVVVAVEEIADLEGAAQADEMADGIGVPEGNIGGVIGAEARSAQPDAMGAAFSAREIEDIMHNHIFIGNMSPDAIGGMNAFVVEAVEIDGVGAINGDAVVIDEPGHRIDQAEILGLMVMAKGRWKNDQRQTAAIPESQHLKLPAQIRRPPFDVTFLHKAGRLL